MLTIPCRTISRHGFVQPYLNASFGPQSVRYFSAGGSLAAWRWNTKTAAKSNRPPGIRTRASALSLKAIFSTRRKRLSRRPARTHAWTWNERTAPTEKIKLPARAPRYRRSEQPPALSEAARKEAALKATLEQAELKRAAAKEAAQKEYDQATAAHAGVFYSMLDTAQPDQVMAAMLNYDFKELVARMPPSIFVEALQLLSPAYFVEPYKEIYRPLLPASLQARGCRPAKSIYDDFVRNISAIIRIRRSAGHRLGLAEYTHLLHCASSVGDANMADYLWHSMERERVDPDIHCYNYYMEAKVWDAAHNGKEKHRLRITPFAYRRRRVGAYGWEGYGTGKRSVRAAVRQIFNKMVLAGYEGDEASISSLLIACARVGDNWAMTSILNIVWNVSAKELRRGDYQKTVSYYRSSPFYPTSRILLAVTHAFGTANDLAGAGRVIEHISKSYDLQIPDTVWAELLERMFVLSRPRYGSDAPAKMTGQISPDACQELFDAMTQGAFNVQPTVDMHRKLAKIAWKKRRVRIFLHHLRSAYKILDRTRRKKQTAREMVESYLLSPRPNGTDMDPKLVRSRGFADAVHAYDVLRHLVRQQVMLVENMVRLLLFRDRWLGRSEDVWERQWVPRLIEEWREFVPCGVVLFTHGGLVGLYDSVFSRSDLSRVRKPSLADDFTPDQSAFEFDDDAIWAAHRHSMSAHDLAIPLLQRLFDPVVDKYEGSLDEDLLETDGHWDATELDEGALAPDFFGSNEPEPKKHWTVAEFESEQRKRAALIETFGLL